MADPEMGDRIVGRAYALGAMIGPYVVERRLARGATSIVYAARGPAGPVAIKALFRAHDDPDNPERVAPHPQAAWGPWARGLFEHERSVLAGLDHPRIPKALDFFHDGGVPALVLELVGGETLRDEGDSLLGELAARVWLPDREVARYGAAVAGILAYLHGRGIAHRDVRLGNVMLDEDGELWLIDFATAAPASPAHVQQDLRMLGELLLRLVVGALPGEGPADPAGLGDGPLDDAIRGALAGRFAGAAELAAALEAARGRT
jgi:serine/threonine protein kinase